MMRYLVVVLLLVALATTWATPSTVAQEAEPSSTFAAAETEDDGVPVDPADGLVGALRRLWSQMSSLRLLLSPPPEAVPTPRQAIQCDSRRGIHSVRDEWAYGRGFDTPEEALQDVLKEGFVLPVRGYGELARRDDVVLYGFRNGGEVKVAVRVTAADGSWIPEWLADCPLAEYGRRADMGPGVWLWANRNDRTIQERRGPAHCRQQSVRMLWWTEPSGKRRHGSIYVRDPEGQFRDQWQSPYLRSTRLPGNARNTGYRRDGATIWMAADRDSVFIEDGNSVQRWPRIPRQAIGCA